MWIREYNSFAQLLEDKNYLEDTNQRKILKQVSYTAKLLVGMLKWPSVNIRLTGTGSDGLVSKVTIEISIRKE